MSADDYAATARATAAAYALGVCVPIVQAGMGGLAGPQLAAAVSNAGALGTVGLYRDSADACRAAVETVQQLTTSSFGVNVIPEVAGLRLLDEQLTAILDSADRAVTVNFYGAPPDGVVERMRGAGHSVAVQLGSLAELLDADADVLVVQGREAGGHHLGSEDVLGLVRAVVRARPDCPVLAAGGIADAAALRRAVEVGAGGAQVGTAFAATAESRAHSEYKQLLVRARAGDTCISERFDIGWSGRSHRVLRNAVTESRDPLGRRFVAVTRNAEGRKVPILRGSANVPTVDTAGDVQAMACYAGTGVDAVLDCPPAAEVVGRLRKAWPSLAVSASPDRAVAGVPR